MEESSFTIKVMLIIFSFDWAKAVINLTISSGEQNFTAKAYCIVEPIIIVTILYLI